MRVARAGRAVEDLADITVTRYPHTELLPRIWALRANLTAYDAAYLALAGLLGTRLVTGDRKVARLPGVRCRAEVLRA